MALGAVTGGEPRATGASPFRDRGLAAWREARYADALAEARAWIAAEVDPWIAAHGALSGVLIHARAFPGWENFAGFLGHVGFIRAHVPNIRRLAIASDSTFLTIAPQITKHFIHAEVRHFGYAECDAAEAWLAGP